MNLLQKLIGGVEHAVGVGGAQPQARAVAGIGSKITPEMLAGYQGPPHGQQTPDITYNSNPHTNIPFSTHNLGALQLLHGGLPAQQTASVGQANRYLNAEQFPQLAQGGNFNPGYTPLQGSNISYGQGPQPTYEEQGQPFPQSRNFSPQHPISLY